MGMMKTRCMKSFKSASSQVQDIVFGSMPMNPLTLPAKGKGKRKIEGLGSEQLGTLRARSVPRVSKPTGMVFVEMEGQRPGVSTSWT